MIMEDTKANDMIPVLCSFFRDLTAVPIHILDEEKSIAAFCSKYCFCSVQGYLRPDQLRGILSSVAKREILHLTDTFRLHFLFFRLSDSLLAAGPYSTDIHMTTDASLLFQRFGLDEDKIPDYLAYRGQFTVTTNESMKKAVLGLIRHVEPEADVYTVTALSYGETVFNTPGRDADVQLLYSTRISNRYAIELQMMDYVTNGNAAAAIENIRILEKEVAYLKQIGNTLENARIGAAITRTCARLAASRAGLSAWLVDRIASRNTEEIFRTNSIEEIHYLQEEVVREYCYHINQLIEAHYSPIVLSTLYYLRRNSREACTLSEIAAELDVPSSTLSTKFRKETGQTISAMLNSIRMQNAARMLAGSTTPIQQIAETVGILDANYFIKVFKKEFSMTPSQYRHSHQI